MRQLICIAQSYELPVPLITPPPPPYSEEGLNIPRAVEFTSKKWRILIVKIISYHRERFYARSSRFSSLYRDYLYIEDRYIGVLSNTFYCNFCGDIEYSSLQWEYGYIEDRYRIGVPLY